MKALLNTIIFIIIIMALALFTACQSKNPEPKIRCTGQIEVQFTDGTKDTIAFDYDFKPNFYIQISEDGMFSPTAVVPCLKVSDRSWFSGTLACDIRTFKVLTNTPKQ